MHGMSQPFEETENSLVIFFIVNGGAQVTEIGLIQISMIQASRTMDGRGAVPANPRGDMFPVGSDRGLAMGAPESGDRECLRTQTIGQTGRQRIGANVFRAGRRECLH